ncbi:MAG: hypothetical protein KY432_08410 [Acidobacteria bacterium]|nr:hypothetical protein [Acidobacteriota bacterium]
MSKKWIHLMSILGVAVLLSLPAAAEQSACGVERSHDECPMKHAKVVSTEEVELEGKLLCRHCNLQETNSCEKVFLSESNERYALCPSGDVKAAESISEHGEATLTVTGFVMKLEDGSSVLRIRTADRS